MTYALIGCGRISANHLRAAVAAGLEIVAACDLVPARMENVLNAHGLGAGGEIRRFCDYRYMLDAVRPELVAIATESGRHAEIALNCIAHGCHVIIEKPIALSMAEARAIEAAGQRAGVQVCACHQNRFNPAIAHIRRALEQGRFGRLSHGCVHVRWNRGPDYYRQAPWRGTWAQDGGALMNQSIHGIDLLRWMMGGRVSEVFAYAARQFHPDIECEDVGVAVLRFESGAVGTIEGTTNVFPRNLEETLYLFGETGTVKAGGKSANTLEVWQFADTRPEDAALAAGLFEQTDNVYGNGHSALYADMRDAIEAGRPPYVTVRDGLEALELVLAIYRSAQTGRPVGLPLDEGQTLDFRGMYDAR